MPFGTRAPSRPKRSGSRRKSTTSCSSSFASSRPATSSHETDAPPTIVFAAVTFGITSSVRQGTYVIRTSRTTKNSGSQAPSSSRKTTSQSIPLSLSAASAVEEAIFFHTIARRSQPDFQPKGRSPLTEHYSVLGPEVTHGPDGELLGDRNSPLLQKLVAFDAVVIAGQAKSHCVAWTIDDLLGSRQLREGGLAEKVYLLEDCTSPVVVPGADYTDEADAAFARFAEAGMHVVRSTEPIEAWPGIAASAGSH